MTIWDTNVSFEDIAKLYGRLLYRMPSAYGLFVSRNGFSPSAAELIYVMHPHNVILWNFDDIEECLKEHKFLKALKYKFQYALMTTKANVLVYNGLNI